MATFILKDLKPAFLTMIMILAISTLFAQQLDMKNFGEMKPRNIGPAGMSGRVTAIDAVISDPSIIYIGSAAGGVWKSENGGDTWTPLFQNEKLASIGAITIDQNNPSILWAGTGEANPRNSANSGYGIYKSLDAGRNWTLMGLENTRTIHRIIIHRDNPDVVIVAATGSAWGDSEDRGVYRTEDGGKSWEKVLYVNNRTGASDLVVDPTNPDKLIAGMWEYRRWPWVFKSGGVGSGLYLSYDAGKTWKEKTEKDGLPSGELGRIGLSIAPSLPNIVYAYIESKSNAIFRSEDGGESWKQVSKKGDNKIGNRPFYYADIYVDTQNENRVYSIATEVTVSEDGGKSWQVFVPGNVVHTDHHAWWSHPDDNKMIILGHDGGINYSFDRGKKWSFSENLPLAQFYHVRVDNEVPYNVYGGLQDNGSWRGPSAAWFKGGIRNMYWQRLSVGDGFDMVPDPEDNEFGWAMGQAGNLYRYNIRSGQLLRSKPVHPDGISLRFNWNAGIAVDPFEKNIVYYGSQFLLKSEDKGQSWIPISPDLTTNDPEKQKQLTTGGLTFDNTGAENFTTIIAIAPSEISRRLIWIGTDDGKVQLTRDGGNNWQDLSGNFRDVPSGTWVPHIHVSKYNASEAFVVFDDHRRDNWIPYVYHTNNYGKSWNRIVDQKDVWGFTYSFIQDPVEPNLYFCGTEDGLYVSLDAGNVWSKWTNGYPTVPTMDMAIQEREGDLVLATFGRSFWILDDIRPLREMAKTGYKEVTGKPLHVFQVPDNYLVNIGESFGYRQGKVGDAIYEGDNKPEGTMISYYLNSVNKDSKDSVKLEIYNTDGKLVRNLYRNPKEGITRLNWKHERNGVRPPNRAKPSKWTPEPGGMDVAPGEFIVKVIYNGEEASSSFKVLLDPRISLSESQISEKNKAIEEYMKNVELVTRAMDKIRESEQVLSYIFKKIEMDTVFNKLKVKSDSLKSRIKEIKEMVDSPDDVQGIYRDPGLLGPKIGTAGFYLHSTLVPYTQNQKLVIEDLDKSIDQFIEEVNKFFAGDWKSFESELKNYADMLLGISVDK